MKFKNNFKNIWNLKIKVIIFAAAKHKRVFYNIKKTKWFKEFGSIPNVSTRAKSSQDL